MCSSDLCSNLTSVDFPDSVTNIGTWAFGSCNLSSLKFGKELKSIGQYAFISNKNLTSVTFNNNLKIIDKYAFSTCISLKKIIIPDGVKEIGLCAFNKCTELENVTIPVRRQSYNKLTSKSVHILYFPLRKIEQSIFSEELVEQSFFFFCHICYIDNDMK